MSIAGRCIARSTSSGMVVGPGRARNSRPARTVIFLVPCGVALGEGMQGNERKFKPEHDDNIVIAGHGLARIRRNFSLMARANPIFPAPRPPPARSDP